MEIMFFVNRVINGFVQCDLDAKPVTSGRLSLDGSMIAVTTLKNECTIYTFDAKTLSPVGKSSVAHE
jgi:hypothetical protein